MLNVWRLLCHALVSWTLGQALLAEQASVTASSIRQFRHTFLECREMLDPEPLLRALKGSSGEYSPASDTWRKMPACTV